MTAPVGDIAQYVVNGAFVACYLATIPFMLFVVLNPSSNIVMNRRILFSMLIPLALVCCCPSILRIIAVAMGNEEPITGVIRRVIKIVVQWNDVLLFMAFFWITHIFASICVGLEVTSRKLYNWIKGTLIVLLILFLVLITASTIVNIVDAVRWGTKRDTSVQVTVTVVNSIQNIIFLLSVIVVSVPLLYSGSKLLKFLRDREGPDVKQVAKGTAIIVQILLVALSVIVALLAISLILLSLDSLSKYILQTALIMDMLITLAFLVCMIFTFGPLGHVIQQKMNKKNEQQG